MKWAALPIIIFLLFGCTNNNKIGEEQLELKSNSLQKDSSLIENKYNEKDSDRKEITIEREFRHYKNSSIKIIEKYKDSFISRDVTIKTKGFLRDKSYKYESIGYVDTVMISDLNNDGENEYYITIGNGGSGGYLDLMAYTVINQELKKIDTSEIDNVLAGKYFDASKIQGHYNYHIDKKFLVNNVPLYNPEDSNCCPTGGELNIYFGYIQDENGGKIFYVKKK